MRLAASFVIVIACAAGGVRGFGAGNGFKLVESELQCCRRYAMPAMGSITKYLLNVDNLF
jgi:hypothetical protein